MAKTKVQKEEAIKEGANELKDSKYLIFADFSSTPDSVMKAFRKMARENDSKFTVIKKRLLRVLLNKSGIEFDPVKYESQVGTIFAKTDISEIASPVYKFTRANPTLNLLGALDVEKKEEITLEELIKIGKLPSRDILLAQLMGGLTGPLRKLMYVLTELANKEGGEESAPTESKESEKSEEPEEVKDSAPAEEAKEEAPEKVADEGEKEAVESEEKKEETKEESSEETKE